MSAFNRTIDIDLSPSGINRAIRELKQFQSDLEECCNELVRVLVEDGMTVAKMNVMSMNAVYTGSLEDSIQGVFFPGERTGVIFADAPYALFVEYGTGIVGAGSPHPGAEGVEWDYDVNSHGEKGWVYYAEVDGNKRFRWTAGQPSRPFMFETMRWLEANAPNIAGKAFISM